MTGTIPSDAPLLSTDALASGKDEDVVQWNVSIVNLLRENCMRMGEMPREAQLAYYLDYYLQQVLNGGIAQFVWNSRWTADMQSLAHDALVQVGASRHLALFEQIRADARALGDAGIAEFLASDFWGPNELRDRLNARTDAFLALDREESLMHLNARWLRSRPSLVVLSTEALRAELQRRIAAIPDLAARRQAVRDAEPAWMKTLRALCAMAGQELVRVNALDPRHEHEGRRTAAHHVTTDRGHHFMIETDAVWLLFDGKTKRQVASLAKPAG
jgi:hypothetical protein